MRPVLVIGGGISGLSAAYYLAKAGIPSTLIERQNRLGGVVQTEILAGCVIETGPDSFLSQKPWAMDLIRELGLADQVIGSNDHLRVTYVWKKGRLVPLPDGLMLMIPTRVLPMLTTRLLGWGTKLRMALEWFRRPRAGGADRSVADFVTEHYGREAVDYLAEPLLAGIYGGDPGKLSVASVLPRFVELEKKYGSLTRGVLAARRRLAESEGRGLPLFQTLKGGLSQLVGALVAAALPKLQVLQGAAEALERTGDGFRVRVGGAWLEVGHVVLACPAYQAGELVSGLDAELAGLLNAIQYSSSITISLGYERSSLNHPLNGFGFLVPKRERRRLAACTWLGTKFSHRVPEHMAVLRCFVGGEEPTSDRDLVAALREELRAIMGVDAEPVFVRVARWPRSMAQYGVGHGERVAQIEARLARLPGLHLAGNAYYGIGVPDCIRMGKQAAEEISRR